uniref:Uncharacterized protein n=1 Tax=viral metagenome TaxID=1070528 RepID=A0A6C0ELT7_9ZZZZ
MPVKYNSISIFNKSKYPEGITFNNTGTKMFIAEWKESKLCCYNLSIPFKLSSAIFNSEISLGYQPGSIEFSTDGFKMFMSDYSFIYQYNLSTPFTPEINGLLIISPFFSYVVYNFKFSDTGDKLFTVSHYQGPTGIRQYRLSNPYDITNITFEYNLHIRNDASYVSDASFNHDGTKLFIMDRYQRIMEYLLTASYDLSSATYTNKITNMLSSHQIDPHALRFNTDGTKMFITDLPEFTGIAEDTSNIFEYNLTVPFDILSIPLDEELSSILLDPKTAVLLEKSLSIHPSTMSINDIVFNDDGQKMFLLGQSVRPPLEAKQMVIDRTRAEPGFDVLSTEEQKNKIAEALGKRFVGKNTIDEYTLLTPFNSISRTLTNTVDLDIVPDGSGIVFSNDGMKMFIYNGIKVFQYTLKSAFNLSDIEATNIFSKTLDNQRSALQNGQRGLSFNNDGRKLFILGDTTTKEGNAISTNLDEYTLSNPFDLSTVLYTKTTSIPPYSNIRDYYGYFQINKLIFNPNGTKMFTISNRNFKIEQYNLSIPFDISTGTNNSVYVSLDVMRGKRWSGVIDLTFNNNGSKIFILVLQYDYMFNNDLLYAESEVAKYELYENTLKVPYDLTGASEFIESISTVGRIGIALAATGIEHIVAEDSSLNTLEHGIFGGVLGALLIKIAKPLTSKKIDTTKTAVESFVTTTAKQLLFKRF